jgi:hypothetical protein
MFKFVMGTALTAVVFLGCLHLTEMGQAYKKTQESIFECTKQKKDTCVVIIDMKPFLED